MQTRVGHEGWQQPEDWQEEATYAMGLQLTGRHTAGLQLTGKHTTGLQLTGTQLDTWQELGTQLDTWQGLSTQLDTWQGLGTQLDTWQELGTQLDTWQGLGTQLDTWQELGTQQAGWQPSEQLVWHMVEWGWSGVRDKDRLVWRLLPGGLYTQLWRPFLRSPDGFPPPPPRLSPEFLVGVTQFRKPRVSCRLAVTQRPQEFWIQSLGRMVRDRQLGTGDPTSGCWGASSS